MEKAACFGWLRFFANKPAALVGYSIEVTRQLNLF